MAGSVASARIAEVLRRVSGTHESLQVRTFSRFVANGAIDPDCWRRLNPELSIYGVGERSSGTLSRLVSPDRCRISPLVFHRSIILK